MSRRLDPITTALPPGRPCTYKQRCKGKPAFWYTVPFTASNGKTTARLKHICADCADTVRKVYRDVVEEETNG